MQGETEPPIGDKLTNSNSTLQVFNCSLMIGLFLNKTRDQRTVYGYTPAKMMGNKRRCPFRNSGDTLWSLVLPKTPRGKPERTRGRPETNQTSDLTGPGRNPRQTRQETPKDPRENLRRPDVGPDRDQS